jgi:hypothetical protein
MSRDDDLDYIIDDLVERYLFFLRGRGPEHALSRPNATNETAQTTVCPQRPSTGGTSGSSAGLPRRQ